MPSRRPGLFARLLAFALLASTPAVSRADFPHDPVFGGLDLTPVSGDQQSPSIVPDGAGGCIVAWNDSRTPANSYDIYAQRFDAFGRPKWAANGVVVCGAPGSQNIPRLVADGAGGAVVVWRDDRATGFGPGYYAQRLNSAGAAQWTADGIRAYSQGVQDYGHQVATDGAGGAWFTAMRDSFGTSQVYLQHVTGAGALPLSATGIPVRTIQPYPMQATIASDGAGGAIVCFRDGHLGPIDVYVQRWNAAGVAQWGANGVLVSTNPGNEANPVCVADGEGGVFVATEAVRSTNDILAQHVDAGGALRWDPAGVVVCGATGTQSQPRIAADGAGGAVIAWTDYRTDGFGDAYAQRIGPLGTPAWTADGVAVSALSSIGSPVDAIVGDGVGGATIVWTDDRGRSVQPSNRDIYAQRVTAIGTAAWTANGVPLSSIDRGEYRPAVVSDGDGGVFVTWDALLVPTSYDLMAQRLDRYGLVGCSAPAITSVRDVLGDQGGHAKVSWNAAWYDADPWFGVGSYRVWRSVATRAAATHGAAARRITTNSDEAAAYGLLLADENALADYAWELAGTQVAAQFASYSMAAPTGGDSTGAGVPRTAYRIEAIAGDWLGAHHWMSLPDSGYSVDNVAPAAPAPFAGVYAAGASTLTWSPNAEPDFASYRLYRGTSADFVPSAVTLLATLGSEGYVDTPGHAYVYKLTAVDVHGNESPVATWVPAGECVIASAGRARGRLHWPRRRRTRTRCDRAALDADARRRGEPRAVRRERAPRAHARRGPGARRGARVAREADRRRWAHVAAGALPGAAAGGGPLAHEADDLAPLIDPARRVVAHGVGRGQPPQPSSAQRCMVPASPGVRSRRPGPGRSTSASAGGACAHRPRYAPRPATLSRCRLHLERRERPRSVPDGAALARKCWPPVGGME